MLFTAEALLFRVSLRRTTPPNTSTTPRAWSVFRPCDSTINAIKTAATGSMLATMLALLASMWFKATIETTKATVPGKNPRARMRSHAVEERGLHELDRVPQDDKTWNR